MRLFLPLDAEHKDELRLLLDVERAILLAETTKTDLLPLCFTVLLDIGFGTLENDASLLLVCLGNLSQLCPSKNWPQ